MQIIDNGYRSRYITNELYEAHEEFQEWLSSEIGKYYQDVVCLKPVSGQQKASIETTFRQFREMPGAIERDIEEFKRINADMTQARCCLPKGHHGKCKRSPSSFFETSNSLDTLIKQCHTSEGDGGIFTNRGSRNTILIAPGSITSGQSGLEKGKVNSILLAQRKVDIANNLLPPPKKDDPANISGPIQVLERAGHPIGIACAAYDGLAFLTAVKGIIYKPEFDEYFPTSILTSAIHHHLQKLIIYFATQPKLCVDIVDSSGYLCDIFDDEILLTQKLCSIKHAVHFGHARPVQSNRFMTRGHNILLLTKDTNQSISSASLEERLEKMQRTAAKRQARLNKLNKN